jgi:hypothetical protein
MCGEIGKWHVQGPASDAIFDACQITALVAGWDYDEANGLFGNLTEYTTQYDRPTNQLNNRFKLVGDPILKDIRRSHQKIIT